MSLKEKLKDPDFQKVVRAMADGETPDIEIKGIKPKISEGLAKALKNPDFLALIDKMADGEKIEVEKLGLAPDIDVMMAERLRRFASWYDAQMNCDDVSKVGFITDVETLPFTNEELAQMDEVIDSMSGSNTGV